MLAAKKKPGPAKGSPGHSAAGRKPTPAATLEQTALQARWQLFPAAHRPAAKAMAIALGIGIATWHRRVLNPGGFTAEQLAAGNALLDAAAPWLAVPAPADFDEESAAR